jgi:carboxylate-amine ligase
MQRGLIFLECIVTWESKIEIGLKLMNLAAHIFALSTNSPFGKADIPATNPGQKYSISFQTGLPEYFESVASYDNFLETLVNTNCIDNPKENLVGLTLASRYH